MNTGGMVARPQMMIVQNGGANRMTEIQDVNIVGINDGETIVYEAATKMFVPGSGGGTTVHSALSNLAYADSGHTGFEPAKGTDDNYVTDAEKTVIGNTSNTNTGDETVTTIKTKLGAADTDSDGYLTSTDWNIFNGKLTNSMATNKLLGRGTTGTGSIEEITLGTGLSLTGTTLNSTFTTSSTDTLTNKRITPRITSAASYTTDTGTSLDVSVCDIFIVTAQAGALKLNNPGGTPTQGQKLIVRIKDDGTARALTYDTQFRAMGNALPSTTVLSKTIYMGFIYNDTDTKWDLIALANEA